MLPKKKYFNKRKNINTMDEFGNEIISPKLKLNNKSERAIICLCDELNELGANTNDSTGFHVHCDAEQLTIEQTSHIAMNYSFFEPVIDKYVHHSRREDNNEFCQSIPFVDPESDNYKKWIDEFESNPDSDELFNPDDKYHKLNFNNLRKYVYLNTIENRHHHGSIDAEEILNWIRFNLLFLEQTIENGICSHLNADISADMKEHLLWDFLPDDTLMNYYTQKTFKDNTAIKSEL
eukprot:526030_1